MPPSKYAENVFINCPFDDFFKPIFDAIVFVVFDCGFVARCAMEIDDASQVRIDKISRIIDESKYSINDISRTELDPKSNLPRFNMPLELGLFLGSKRFGEGKHKKKACLILDRKQYRYQAFISDIAGQDIKAHNDLPEDAISVVRNWLRDASERLTIPGGREIRRRYEAFRNDLPEICSEARVDEDELTFNEYCNLVSDWLRENE